MPKPPGRLAAAVYRYRTEGDSPVRQALAVGLGLFIGCSPFIGFHLLLSLGLGWLFGLNRFKVYLAANISNPIVAPFLYAAEVQTGTWLRTGRFLTAARLDEVRLQGLAIDILIGSVVIGLTLAVAGTLLTYWGAGGRSDPERTALVDAAAERYLTAGCAAWEFARSKLRMDPVYLDVLLGGRLPRSGVLYDLGCGQGLMLALIAAARDRFQRGLWPANWPPPPPDLRLHGIETRPRVARRARLVLDDVATIEETDLSRSALPSCDAVLLFDVLHLLSRETQDRLLTTAAQVMPVGGVMMIREADAAGGWKFTMVRAGNRFNAIMQGRAGRRFQFDTVDGWIARLTRLGFDVEAVSKHDRGAFANVLIQARKTAKDMEERHS
jgi:SAM-dependent methyltransferase